MARPSEEALIRMLRYCVAFFAVCMGVFAAVADSIALSLPPPQQGGAPGKQAPNEGLFVFEVCVIFYGVTCATGRFLYRLFGAHAEVEELGSSRWHMGVLNTVLGGLLVASGAQALLQGAVPLSVLVGALLIGMEAKDVWRALRRLRAGGVSWSTETLRSDVILILRWICSGLFAIFFFAATAGAIACLATSEVGAAAAFGILATAFATLAWLAGYRMARKPRRNYRAQLRSVCKQAEGWEAETQ